MSAAATWFEQCAGTNERPHDPVLVPVTLKRRDCGVYAQRCPVCVVLELTTPEPAPLEPLQPAHTAEGAAWNDAEAAAVERVRALLPPTVLQLSGGTAEGVVAAVCGVLMAHGWLRSAPSGREG